MLNDKLQRYLEEMVPERNDLLMEMESYAKEHKVPIMEIEGIEAMLQILRIKQPKTILEVGTAIGYSALRMVYECPQSRIVTLERDAERYEQAEMFIAKSGKADQILLIKGDALEKELEVKEHGLYDVIFIDAAKGQYKRFFELYSKYLNNEGLIITDNVLFKGLVYEEEIDNKRIRNMVRKINDFNQWLMTHEEYHTVILPIGDGVAISRKK